MEQVELPSTLKRIEYSVFEDCKNLQNITLPNSLESIGKRCFCDSEIKEITVLHAIKRIGECTFNVCSNLRTLWVEEGCTIKVAGGNVVVLPAHAVVGG